MPMPHRTFAQLAKRRLVGKEGRERAREVNALLAELPDYKNGPYADLRKSLLAELEELPDYKNGPYADIRKWVNGEIDGSRMRSKVVHRDSIAVRREGAAQVALVGPPNVGKSSLLQALSDIQIKTGYYAFTTLRPVPALTRIGGVLVQLVEIPGLIEGANEDRGGGRALLGVLRSAGVRSTPGSPPSPSRTAEPPLPEQASEEGAGRTRAVSATLRRACRAVPRAKEM